MLYKINKYRKIHQNKYINKFLIQMLIISYQTQSIIYNKIIVIKSQFKS